MTSFLSRIGFIESEEQEQARLAQSPEGSINHGLSRLPVTIREWPQDLIIELPWHTTERDCEHRVVVVPLEFHKGSEDPAALPRRRFGGTWDCAVVSSTHPSYPVGGYRLSITAAELARGRRIEI